MADILMSNVWKRYPDGFEAVKAQEVHTAELDELAADAGMEDLPSHGDGQQVVARLSAESPVTPGEQVELSLDTTQIKLFDQSGHSLLGGKAR